MVTLYYIKVLNYIITALIKKLETQLNPKNSLVDDQLKEFLRQICKILYEIGAKMKELVELSRGLEDILYRSCERKHTMHY